MSYDQLQVLVYDVMGLNPFGTGQCLTTNIPAYLDEQGGLNPFGTGQCLTT